METDFHPNTVVICTICSDAVIIRYDNMKMNMPDFDLTYLLRLTTCYTCSKKIARSNMMRYMDMSGTSSTEITSDEIDYMDMESPELDYPKSFIPINKRLLESFNTPIGTLMVVTMPMYKRMMSYLNGNMITKTLNGFSVIENLSSVTPNPSFQFTISSVIVGLSKDAKMSKCGCMNDLMKETVTEVPYDNQTFFANVIA